MTGFGRASASEDNYSVSVELKTVNNRFLDVNLRLPSEISQLETTIKRLLSNRLSRGRVEVNLQYDRQDPIEFELNEPLVAGFLSAMTKMKAQFALAGEPDINVVARLPNVINTKKQEPGPEFLATIERVFESAIDDLEQMRSEEGSMLKADLLANVASIECRLPVIEEQTAAVAGEYALRLTKRVNELLAKTESQLEIDQGRIAQEAAFLADKADIAEEVTRLRSHIEHFRTIASEETDVGKRLDFLTQEFNREANTIASKTGNMIVKENALAIKSEIEKIREQVQNIE